MRTYSKAPLAVRGCGFGRIALAFGMSLALLVAGCGSGSGAGQDELDRAFAEGAAQAFQQQAQQARPVQAREDERRQGPVAASKEAAHAASGDRSESSRAAEPAPIVTSPAPSPAAPTAPPVPVGSGAAPTAVSTDPTGITNCSSSVAVGAATSCAFGASVHDAWVASGGSSLIEAYSPVTGETYDMSCSGNKPVVCHGGENAYVYIP